MGDPEKIDLLKSRFYAEAQIFKQANEALRGAIDGEGRIHALGSRVMALEQTDILLDTFNELAA